VKQINVGIIGTGWCGGIRADTCAINPAVKDIHIVETRPERLAEVAKSCNAKTATDDYHKLLEVKDLDAVMISATPGKAALPDGPRLPRARPARVHGKTDRRRTARSR